MFGALRILLKTLSPSGEFWQNLKENQGKKRLSSSEEE
jgi:hypothetical protein